MTVTDDTLPHWDVSDLHESLDARTFTSAVESFEATIERLRALFDERDGRLAAFCWTKLHRDASGERDEAGEIYVIAVDPDFRGLGLGSELTVAGLESIHDRGVTSALLYVDAANTAAVAMYERLGFDVSRRDRACSAILGGDDRH